MCGGLVVNSTKNLKENLSYQIGRLVSYSLISFFLFFLGQTLATRYINSLASLGIAFFSLWLIYLGLSSFFKFKKIKSILSHVQARLYRTSFALTGNKKSFSIGFLSILLPCGFLYSFLVVVVLAPNIVVAMTSLLAFWIGTLPGLLASAWMLEKIFHPIRKKFPKVIPLLLILMGVYSLSLRVSSLLLNSNTCH